MAQPDAPTCFIHIGPHKTGSSSLKHFLRANEETLEQRGLFFPRSRDAGGKRARNHLVLAASEELTPGGEVLAGAVFWPEIEQAARDARPNILISSEMFCALLADESRFAPILAFFERHGYAVRILAYLRDQPAWLNSWYVQSQKRLTTTATFADFAAEWLRDGRVEPARYLAPFLGEARCSVEIIPFERAAASGLEDDFMRRCGIDDTSAFERPAIRNTNAGAKTVYAARQIMQRAGRSPREHKNYAKIYRDFKLVTRELGWDQTPYVGLGAEEADRIRAQMKDTNDAFAQRHFGMDWSELCPPKPILASTFDPVTSAREEVDEIEAVVERFVRRFSR